MEKIIHTASEADTMACAEALGASLQGGECIILVGDIGAGKTTFTKGLARGLKIDDPVQSPTFTINRTYDARDNLVLSHYDFYRLPDAGIMADELDEAVKNQNYIIVIEWADVVKSVIPDDYLSIIFRAVSEHERELKLKSSGARSDRCIEEMSV